VVTTAAIAHQDSATGPLSVVIPWLAVVAGAAGALPRLRIGAGGAVVAAIAVTAWAIPVVPTLTRPIRFSLLSPTAVDVLVPVALGLALGAGAAVYLLGSWAARPQPDESDRGPEPDGSPEKVRSP
jgi:hypothetical protein